jgi:hypothetical protein
MSHTLRLVVFAGASAQTAQDVGHRVIPDLVVRNPGRPTHLEAGESVTYRRQFEHQFTRAAIGQQTRRPGAFDAQLEPAQRDH